MLKWPAYVTISSAFFILIGIGFAYSYFFYPNSHPIPCIVKLYTGKDCSTCGFSRAFSYYSHGQPELGKRANSLSWPVFLFFAFQLVLRFFIVLTYYISKKAINPLFIVLDGGISISFFLLAFLPLILKA